MGVWSFTSFTRHRWRKTKEQKPWNNTKQILPWTDHKELFCFTSFVSSTRSFDRSLGAIICTNCQFVWSGKCTFDCHDQSVNSKNYASGNHVSTSSCMLRIEKLITFNMTCTWTFHNSLLRSIVMITFIIFMNCTLKTLLHVISISVIMFALYCYLQTISCQVWLWTKTSANILIAVVHLTI